MTTLGSGTVDPIGPEIAYEDLYIEGGPDIYFQDFEADEQNNPDGDTMYWGLSGTATYPIYNVGCYDDMSISENREETAVTCASLGEVARMQRRSSLEVTLTLKSLLPLEVLNHLISGGGAVVHNVAEETEKMGIGSLPQNQYFHVYMARVYDETIGDWISITYHKVQFGSATPLQTPYAAPWTYGIRMLVLADASMPRAQRFATWIRWDPSAL